LYAGFIMLFAKQIAKIFKNFKGKIYI
jgi:hypothetical protein